MTGKTWALAATLPFGACCGPDPVDAGPARSAPVADARVSSALGADLRVGLRGNDRTGRLSCGENHVCWLDAGNRLWCGFQVGPEQELVLEPEVKKWRAGRHVPRIRFKQVAGTTEGIAALDEAGTLHVFAQGDIGRCGIEYLERLEGGFRWQVLAVAATGYDHLSGLIDGHLSYFPFPYTPNPIAYRGLPVDPPEELVQAECETCLRGQSGTATCSRLSGDGSTNTHRWQSLASPLVGLSVGSPGDLFGLREDGGIDVLNHGQSWGPIERVPAPPVPLAAAESIHGSDVQYVRVGDWLMPLGYYAARPDDTWRGVPILIRPPPGGSPVVDYCSTWSGLCVLRESGDVECFNQRGQPLRFPFVDLLTP